jgi:hypothetical protein
VNETEDAAAGHRGGGLRYRTPRRRGTPAEEIGFSYVVAGAAFADALARVMAELAGR